MTDPIRPDIKALSAYHVPPAMNMVKLDAMENPFGLPESLRQQWAQQLVNLPVNRYPDPSARELTAELKTVMQVPGECELMLGNGSDEIIQILALSTAKPGACILAPEPTFVMYNMIACYVGMKYVGVPLKEDFSLDRDALLDAVETHQPALIFFAYPNNPTANLFDESIIDEVLEVSQGLVVVDEAYHPFAEKSYMQKLTQYKNLLVMRTLSKMGLAGLRLGMIAGDREWLQEFNKVRLPYNINVLTQASARFALQHGEVFEEQARIIREQRSWVHDQLVGMQRFQVYPSRANFILFRLLEDDADAVFERLKEQGVLIKNSHTSGGMLTQCLRVTVGTPEENQAFIDALGKAVGK